MPIIHSKLAIQAAVLPPNRNAVGFPSKIADWLAKACNNYLYIDHWKSSSDGIRSISRYSARANAHINRIPVEILGEIFMHCLTAVIPAQASPLPTSLSPSSEADPQTLGEVCRSWRDVTLSTPALWSRMWIYEPQRAQIQRVVLWLQRSRAYALDIRIVQFTGSVTPKDHTATDEILSHLIREVHRWRKVYFSFASAVHQPLLTLPMGAPIALESAYFHTSTWEHAIADGFWRILHSSPSLRHASWASYTKALPNHIPWVQLTSITFYHGLSVEECIQILKECQHLVAFCVHTLWSYDALVDPQGPLLLPKLQSLSFLGCVESTPFFNRLTLPSLNSLDITTTHPHHHDEGRSCTSFRDLLQRSSCRLERFRFSSQQINEDHLYGYLSASQMVTLKELELCAPVTDRVVMSLTRNGKAADPYLLPGLEAIYVNDLRTSDGCMSSMILSRKASHAPTPLKIACVEFEVDLYPCDLAVFQSIRHGGWLRVIAI